MSEKLKFYLLIYSINGFTIKPPMFRRLGQFCRSRIVRPLLRANPIRRLNTDTFVKYYNTKIGKGPLFVSCLVAAAVYAYKKKKEQYIPSVAYGRKDICEVPRFFLTRSFYIDLVKRNLRFLNTIPSEWREEIIQKILDAGEINAIKSYQMKNVNKECQHLISKLIDPTSVIENGIGLLKHFDKEYSDAIIDKLPDSMLRDINMNHLEGMVLTGKQFNKLTGCRKLFKNTNGSETHNGLQYHTGRNVDPILFNPHGSCSAGGIYFAEEKYIGEYNTDNKYRRRVTIPDDALVYVEGDKFKANVVVLGEREFIPIDVHDSLRRSYGI